MFQRILDAISTFEWVFLKEWALLAVILLAAFILGFFFKKICRSRLCRIPERVTIAFGEATLHRLTSRFVDRGSVVTIANHNQQHPT